MRGVAPHRRQLSLAVKVALTLFSLVFALGAILWPPVGLVLLVTGIVLLASGHRGPGLAMSLLAVACIAIGFVIYLALPPGPWFV